MKSWIWERSDNFDGIVKEVYKFSSCSTFHNLFWRNIVQTFVYSEAMQAVMGLARESADGMSREYIGDENLLEGLMYSRSPSVAAVLTAKGIRVESVLSEITRLAQSGPNAVSLAEKFLTPRAYKAMGYADEERYNAGRQEIRMMDLLTGLLREKEGTAAQILTNLGLNLEDLRIANVEVSQ